MNLNMNMNNRAKSIWWREPMVWLVITLPLLAVVAALTSVWIAYRHAPSVYKSYYDQNTDIVKANEMDKRADYLSLSASVTVTDGSVLNVDLTGKMKTRPQSLVLKLAGPAASGAVSSIILPLQPDRSGIYKAVLPARGAGEQRLVIEPKNRRWRLAGSWEAPFTGKLRLVAKSVSDSSMLP